MLWHSWVLGNVSAGQRESGEEVDYMSLRGTLYQPLRGFIPLLALFYCVPHN